MRSCTLIRFTCNKKNYSTNSFEEHEELPITAKRLLTSCKFGASLNPGIGRICGLTVDSVRAVPVSLAKIAGHSMLITFLLDNQIDETAIRARVNTGPRWHSSDVLQTAVSMDRSSAGRIVLHVGVVDISWRIVSHVRIRRLRVFNEISLGFGRWTEYSGKLTSVSMAYSACSTSFAVAVKISFACFKTVCASGGTWGLR